MQSRSGTNLPRVREYNRARVLEIVRTRGPVSRRVIAETSGLTFQAVSNIVGRLVESGFVVEDADPVYRGGKQSRGVVLNEDAAYAVGVQFGRYGLSAAAMNFAGRMLASDHSDVGPSHGPAAVLAEIREMVGGLIKECSLPEEKVSGVGVGVPGPFDYAAGRFLEPPNMEGWEGFPIRERLERELGTVVTVDNNATAAALGERWNGLGAEVADFVYLYLENGIGSGIVANDQVCRGATGNSGAIGHVQVEPDGPPCYCGNRGCLELYATPQGILREARKAVLDAFAPRFHGGAPYPETFEEVVRSDDPVLRGVVRAAGDRLGRVASSVASVLDPELIVLGGPTAELVGEEFREAIVHALPLSSLPGKPLPRVEISLAGRHAGPLGAAALVFQDLYASSMDQLNLA